MKKKIGYIAKLKEPETADEIVEKFEGKVENPKVKYPQDLGVEHPFDFESVERVYKRVSIISGAVNKYVDNIMGEFTIRAKNPNSEAIIKKFLRTTNFSTVMRAWIREGVLKGNGFMELDLKNSQIRVLNANYMYVERDEEGNVTGYNQFIPQKRVGMKAITIPFKPEQIAHLKINDIAGEAYGLGLTYPNERAIETMVLHIEDFTKMIKRKANMPIHAKVGIPGQSTNSKDVDDFAERLQFMNNCTEWVTDGNVDMKVLDFSAITESMVKTLQNDLFQVMAGIEVPEVLLGSGQLNEGIAKVQLEGWQRKIASLQEVIESIVEEKIFKPLLNSNKLDEVIEFIWNLPGEEEINRRIEKVSELIKSPFISPVLRAGMEIEIARLLDMNDVEKILIKPQKAGETEDQEREEEEEEIEQPEVPGAKPNANELQEKIKSYEDMTIQEFVNLQEIKGFNYTDYLIRILQRLNIDPFAFLRATNKQEVLNGLFDDNEIERLRTVLKNGFKKNKTIRQIERDIESNIDLRDRIIQGKIVAARENRAVMIARTETVRLANMGLVDLYKENGVEKVRFLAALSDRTCPICEGLNAQVFDIKELKVGQNQPPIHSGCRCTLISV